MTTPPKTRAFAQNKLWRDGAIDLMEQAGSVVHWTALDDEAFGRELRRKLLEEAEEVAASETREELCGELADVLEVVECLCDAHGLTMQEVLAAKQTKKASRGGFAQRAYVTVAEHQVGSIGERYCLAAPHKYPEIS